MFHLPYLPQPYPDEIFGSWLSRILLNNGKGVWQVMIKKSKFIEDFSIPTYWFFNCFDIPPYCVELESFLNILGTTYERVLLELTTLPYWLTFDSESLSQKKIPGALKISGLVSANGKYVHQVTAKVMLTGRSSDVRVKFCPHCLEHDREIYGEPYWHRSHQLPFAKFCTDHYCQLLTQCPVCRRDISSKKNGLITLPKLKCDCGNILSNVYQSEQTENVDFILEKISTQALNCTSTSWDFWHVREYLLSTYLSLKEPFNKVQNTSSVNSRNAANMKNIARDFSRMRAPDCCQLLVTLGIDFKQATSGFESFVTKKINPECCCSSITSIIETELESVRIEMRDWLNASEYIFNEYELLAK
jgi:hypothetical protein